MSAGRRQPTPLSDDNKNVAQILQFKTGTNIVFSIKQKLSIGTRLNFLYQTTNRQADLQKGQQLEQSNKPHIVRTILNSPKHSKNLDCVRYIGNTYIITKQIRNFTVTAPDTFIQRMAAILAQCDRGHHRQLTGAPLKMRLRDRAQRRINYRYNSVLGSYFRIT